VGIALGRRAIGVGAGLFLSFVACAVYLAWELAHRGSYQYNTAVYAFDDADEWRYTACGRLVEHGYALFSQVFSAQPPVLFVTLAAGMRLFGGSIGSARAVEVMFGLLALVCTAWITWLVAGPVAAGIAAAILAATPGFLVYSRAVEAEGPMMALVALSLALALTYRRTERFALVPLAGLALAAAVLTKLFALEALAPGLWVVLAPAGTRRRAWAAAGYLAAAVVPVAVEMGLVSPSAQWRQVIAMHSAAASLALPGSTSPLRVMAQFFALDFGLTVLALAGLVVLAVLAAWDDAVFLWLWLPLSAVMLVLFRPLFPHHPIILLPSMAVAAGCAGTVWVEQLRSRRWLAALPLAGVVLVYLALTPRIVHDDRHALVPGVPSQELRLVRYVDAHSRPPQMIAADDLQVADRAQRLVPPALCDPSNVRYYAGYITRSTLVAQTRQYRPALVVVRGVFGEVPGYVPWLRRHYRPLPAVAGARVFGLR
jgi:4-amino-4-deoxy-L-arabinose transferase-like glycosyltransferase